MKSIIAFLILGNSIPWARAEQADQDPVLDAPSESESQPSPDAQPQSESIQPHTEPSIIAKGFKIKVLQRSNSTKIYLFDDLAEAKPEPGSVLLLKRANQPIIAVQVILQYPDKKIFAAKRVKKYSDRPILMENGIYLAIKKVSDLETTQTNTTEKSPISAEDTKDLSEIEKKEGIEKELDQKISNQDETVLNHNELSTEESEPFETTLHWLTAGFGYVRNNGPPTSKNSYYFSSGNLRYGLNLAHLILLIGSHAQDSLSVEGGFYLYKAINFSTQGDAYSILGIAASGRYNVFFSKSFAVFLSLGTLQNYVFSGVNTQTKVLAVLNNIQPIAGVGFIFQTGPGWYIRTDIGIDSIGLNLTLRF